MTSVPSAPLHKTPLHAVHVAAGARMVPYAGWEMPVEYAGITQEHLAVRQTAGIFDVSHMGEIEIAGKGALDAVQHISCNDASRLAVGQAHLSGLLTPQGTFVDDLLVYRIATSHFLLVVNAANVDKDFAWIQTQLAGREDVACVNASNRYALIAVQGPAAASVVQPLTGIPLTDLRYYWFSHGEVAGARALVSRTGYTGQDGYEIFVPPAQATAVFVTGNSSQDSNVLYHVSCGGCIAGPATTVIGHTQNGTIGDVLVDIQNTDNPLVKIGRAHV